MQMEGRSMTYILISINPPYTKQIFSGEKTVEWRRRPLPNGTYYCCETKNGGGCGMVIGEFEITGNRVFTRGETVPPRFIKAGCVDAEYLREYAGYGDKASLAANYIRHVVLYDNPVPITEFWKVGKCPYSSLDGCTYKSRGLGHINCFRGGETQRCGTTVANPPQSWMRVERRTL